MMPDVTLYHFDILASTMHMAWVRAVCGRLKFLFERYQALTSLLSEERANSARMRKLRRVQNST